MNFSVDLDFENILETFGNDEKKFMRMAPFQLDGEVVKKAFQVSVFAPIAVKKFGTNEVHSVGVIAPADLTNLLLSMDKFLEDVVSPFTSNVKKVGRETMFFKLKTDPKGKYECNKTLNKNGLKKGQKIDVELQFNVYFNAKDMTAGISIEVLSLK